MSEDLLTRDYRALLLHRMRRFIVTFNNSKKHGAFPVRQHTAEGVLFTSGRVVIDTEDFAQKGFMSMNEMEETMRTFGVVDIDYIDFPGHGDGKEKTPSGPVPKPS